MSFSRADGLKRRSLLVGEVSRPLIELQAVLISIYWAHAVIVLKRVTVHRRVRILRNGGFAGSYMVECPVLPRSIVLTPIWSIRCAVLGLTPQGPDT